MQVLMIELRVVQAVPVRVSQLNKSWDGIIVRDLMLAELWETRNKFEYPQ